MTLLVFAVASPVLPRVTRVPFRRGRLAGLHWWLSNAGLVTLTAGFLWRPHVGPRSTLVLGTGAVLSAVGAYLFVSLMLDLLRRR